MYSCGCTLYLIFIYISYVYIIIINRYWEEVLIVLQTPEKQLSTVLLVFPELELFGNYELFEAYCDWLAAITLV